MTINFQALAAEFPREAISWRAQSVTRDGKKAMALAYIDARDVMRRLDEVCGPENWKDSYVETAKGRVLATIEIWTGDRWVSKSDGAGDTDVEGDKGGISDAFKRAAVKWGIGRYLYDMPAPWVPCDSYEQEWQGKKKWVWKAWQQSPWDFVRAPANSPVSEAPKPASKAASREAYDRLSRENRALTTEADFNAYWAKPENQDAAKSLPADWKQTLKSEKDDKAAELAERAAMQSDNQEAA